MMYVNLAAFLCAAAQRSRHFFNCIRLLAANAIDGVIPLVLYEDLVVPGNKLRPDTGRSYHAIYWGCLHLLSWMQHILAFRWLGFSYLHKSELQDAGVSEAALIKELPMRAAPL